MGNHLFKTFLFTLVMPGSVAGLVPYLLQNSALGEHRFETGPWRWAGILPLTIGLAGYLWCAWDFACLGEGTPAPIDPPKKLVVRGLYRVSRNPMYLAILLVIVGEALIYQAWAIAGYAAVTAAAFHLFVCLYEEPYLRKTFGPHYCAYCDRVPRWLFRMQFARRSD